MKNPSWHRDEIILALDLYFAKDRGSVDSKNPKIIGLSKILNQLPIFAIRPNQTKFRNPNGVSLKLSNFMALDASHSGTGMRSYSRLDKEIFEEFALDKETLHDIANKIISVVKDSSLIAKVAQIEEDENTENDRVKEGQVLYKLHKFRERDPKIVNAKKSFTLTKTGTLSCEACKFDFKLYYGNIGEGFIECHHIVPLSNFASEKKTALKDLALVCSNCHRMLHRDLKITSIAQFQAKYLSPQRKI